MKISTEKYAQALFELLKEADDTGSVSKIITNFIDVLVKNNDFYRSKRIFKDFKKIWDKEFNTIQMEISSVYQLEPIILKTILDHVKTTSKMDKIESKNNTNQDILGGVVIKYGDKIFDSSLRTRLQRLKESLLS